MLKCEIIYTMKNEILNNAAITGISDFYFKGSKKDKRVSSPVWMSKKEKQAWELGKKYARQILIN